MTRRGIAAVLPPEEDEVEDEIVEAEGTLEPTEDESAEALRRRTREGTV